VPVLDVSSGLSVPSSALPAGSILQVVSTTKTDTFTTNSTSFVDITGVSLSITPRATSSKILVMYSGNFGSQTSGNVAHTRLMRDSTAIAIGDAAGSRNRSSNSSIAANSDLTMVHANQVLDSPNTTSAVTYKLQIARSGATADVFVNRSYSDSGSADSARTVTTITAMEVAG
jgi:hypothetical protein